MDSMWSPWILAGLHSAFPNSLHGVHGESTESPCGVYEDSTWSPQVHGDSMGTPETVFHGLLMDSPWTPHGLSIDSMDSKGTASLIYLIKMNFNHYKNKCPQRESNSEPFGPCITTRRANQLC